MFLFKFLNILIFKRKKFEKNRLFGRLCRLCIVFRFGGVWKRPPEFQTALKHVEQITRQILLSALLALASSQFDF